MFCQTSGGGVASRPRNSPGRAPGSLGSVGSSLRSGAATLSTTAESARAESAGSESAAAESAAARASARSESNVASHAALLTALVLEYDEVRARAALQRARYEELY